MFIRFFSLFSIIWNIQQTVPFKLFLSLGIDRQLAEHVAHLFVRDPISVFKEKLVQDDENDTDHFEVLYATYSKFIRL